MVPFVGREVDTSHHAQTLLLSESGVSVVLVILITYGATKDPADKHVLHAQQTAI